MPLANSYSADDVDDDDIMFLDEGGANAVTLLVSMVTMSVVAATANLVMVNNIISWGYARPRDEMISSTRRNVVAKLQHEPLLSPHHNVPMKSVAIATVVLLAASASAFAPPANPITVKSSTATANTALNAVWDD